MAFRSASGVACMFRQQRFTGLVEDAHVRGAGMEVDAAGKRGVVWCRIA